MNTMTPEKAELLGTISAELMERLSALLTTHQNEIDVLDLLFALGVTCKGIGMVLRENNPAVPDQREVEHQIILSFVRGMSMPNEVIQTVKVDDDGPLKAAIIPVNRH